ncbi:PREDICTED: uncharacterized protein LOC102027833 [Chinchilla lanigera]|uniref:uncharacterized protein LOC102027833 n=1 Tax=Chinchilla lanigera TaxID=34839 RepID=UPI00038EFFFE|nr:PREDICTED: uncharacterized protein LOC102027833 [Chinchilla lanigera]
MSECVTKIATSLYLSKNCLTCQVSYVIAKAYNKENISLCQRSLAPLCHQKNLWCLCCLSVCPCHSLLQESPGSAVAGLWQAGTGVQGPDRMQKHLFGFQSGWHDTMDQPRRPPTPMPYPLPREPLPTPPGTPPFLFHAKLESLILPLKRMQLQSDSSSHRTKSHYITACVQSLFVLLIDKGKGKLNIIRSANGTGEYIMSSVKVVL